MHSKYILIAIMTAKQQNILLEEAIGFQTHRCFPPIILQFMFDIYIIHKYTERERKN